MTRARSLALAAFATLLVPRAAHAGYSFAAFEHWHGGAAMHYELSYVHRTARPAAGTADPAGDGLGLAGVRLRGFAGPHHLGYLIGLELHAGSTNPGGFAYQCDLYPIGVAVKLGETGAIGLGAGVGASGAIGTLDDGAEFPVEAFGELPLGGHLRVMARARAVWLAGASARGGGSPTLSFADEVDGSFALRLGHRYHDFGFPSGNGWFAGVGYREAMGARFAGLVLGYAADVGSR